MAALSPEFLAGATAEAHARDDHPAAARAVRDVVEGLADLRASRGHEVTEAGLVAAAFRIYTAGLPWWRRLLLAMTDRGR